MGIWYHIEVKHVSNIFQSLRYDNSLWNYGLVISILTFDIKDYFNFVNYECLFNKMKKYYIFFKLVKWIANFLFNWETIIYLDGIWKEIKPIKYSTNIFYFFYSYLFLLSKPTQYFWNINQSYEDFRKLYL